MIPQIFSKTPVLLLMVIVAIALVGPVIPLEIKQFLYGISLSIKSVIVFLLPLIVFSLLFKAAVTLSHNATRMIGLILVGVCCSNFITTFFSHFVGELIYNLDFSLNLPLENKGLEGLWVLTLPKIISNDIAMFSGLILGILASLSQNTLAPKVALFLDQIVSKILKVLMILIPFFVAGFVVKLQHDDVIGIIVKDYTIIFLVIALVQFSYIVFGYLFLNNWKLKAVLSDLKNMVPAAISAFSTMSSAATMPLTLIGVKKMTKDKDLAASVIPATVNVHLIGDCIAIPILAYGVLKSFGMDEPSFINYTIFALYFVLAKFSVAAIPGGGILVMLPILEANLGFTSSMMSLITALYILLDPVITCANVLGNGGFAKMIDRILPYVGKPVKEEAPEGIKELS